MGKTSKAAVVRRLIDDSRVVVETESNEFGTIQQEVFAPDVPLSWIFREGMRLTGEWNPADKTYLPHRSIQDEQEVANTFGLGNVTLGLVQSVTRKTARVAIMPGVVFEMVKAEITGNPLDVISSYLDVGDVIAVRIYRHPQGKIRLRMDDIDDDDPILPSLPIFKVGAPWLELGRDLPWLTDSEETIVSKTADPVESVEPEPVVSVDEGPLTPTPGPGIRNASPSPQPKSGRDQDLNNARFAAKHSAEQQRRLTNQNERLRIERLQSDQEVERLQEKLRTFTAEISDLRSQLAESRKQRRAQQSMRSTTFDRRARWADDVDWLNEEIRRAWIGRYKPFERSAKYPLNFDKFCFSPNFFDSVGPGKLTEEEVRKLVRVLLDIASGRNATEHKHTVHEKFTHLGGPQESRSDGSLLWRVHLESGVPAAKRLHYWQRKDGVTEFGWVANHDDDL